MFIAPPAAGKGTQSEIFSKKYNLPHISTGDIFREIAREDSEVGEYIRETLKNGDLVKDEITYQLIKDRLAKDDCNNGFILDGFPRTIPQAEALDTMGVKIDKVIDIEVPDERIIGRMSGRRVCGSCGASYHLEYKVPKTEGVCDLCAGALVQRKDDHPDTVKARLEVYHSETEPLKEYYSKQGKLAIVEGQEEIADTTALVFKELEA